MRGKMFRCINVLLIAIVALLCLYSCEGDDEGLERDRQELAFIAAQKKIAKFLAENQVEKAEDTFDSLKYDNTKSYDYFFVGGTVKMNRQKYEDAIRYFKNALEIYETEAVYINLTKIYRLKNDSTNFILSIKRLLELNPKEAIYYREYADYFASQRLYSVAIDYINKAIYYGPENYKADQYVCRATYYYEYGNLTAAIADLDSAIRIDKDQCLAHIIKTNYYLKSRLYRDAIRSANQGLKTNCDKGHLLYRRGLAKFNANDVLGGKEDILKAIELQNEDALNYVQTEAPYGFKVLFPLKYREMSGTENQFKKIEISADSCKAWKLLPLTFTASAPANYSILYHNSTNDYCCIRLKNKDGIIVHDLKFVEGLSRDEKKDILDVQRTLQSQFSTYTTTSLGNEIIDQHQYYVLRGRINLDQHRIPGYSGDYEFAFFFVKSRNGKNTGCCWNEFRKSNIDLARSKAITSKILHSIQFY